MHISGLLDVGLLDEMLAQGYVGTQTHPTEALTIYNYTHRAQYDRVWNDVTRQCRGLIVDDTGLVVARPFPKFFNYGEHDEGTFHLDAPVTVTDKLDGSLGILYPLSSGGWAIATRGSFQSDQALWATEWLQRHVPSYIFDFRLSYLFEILAKWNRIVVDYEYEGLVLIGVRETETGRDLDLSVDSGTLSSWPSHDDSREHLRSAEDGLEDVSSVPKRELPQGSRTPRGEAAVSDEDMARGEPGASERAPSRSSAGDPRRNERSEGELPVRGLREDVPERLHGLRPYSGREGLQRGASEDAEATPRRDREVRASLRELPSDQDRDEARRRIFSALGVTEEEVAAIDGGYAAAKEGAERDYAVFVGWARGLADDLARVLSVACFMPVVERHPYRTLREALAAEPRLGAEGLVVQMGWDRVKIKQDDYVALHRIVTGLNERVVWERLGNGETVRDICEHLPDEFAEWVDRVARDLNEAFQAKREEARAEFSAVQDSLPGVYSRREFAEKATRSPNASAAVPAARPEVRQVRLVDLAGPEAVGSVGPAHILGGRRMSERNSLVAESFGGRRG